ncbi:MAG: pro-sigmaK processing inhibitor BofA family protein [Firmicutes bacterium]|nr:pro-sigmaK processing inhibitor BofA family protein [Bacillota bacterium]
MTSTQLLILIGIILLSLSVVAIISPKAFCIALKLLLNGLFGILALTITYHFFPQFPVGINFWSILISALLGLPGMVLLMGIGFLL